MRFFMPITKKEDNSVVKAIAIRQKERKLSLSLDKLKPYITYGLLYKNEYNKWRIANKNGCEEIPSGTYAFVRTKLGFLQVTSGSNNGCSGHLGLSGYAYAVRYAGEIIFKTNNSGEMVSWNNRSGSYKPGKGLCKQAGLPLDLFVAEKEQALDNKKLNNCVVDLNLKSK